MSENTKALEVAQTICQPSYFGGTRADDAQHILDVAKAIDEAKQEARDETMLIMRNHRESELLAELAEAKEQLAAERAMADRLANTLGFITAHGRIDYEQKHSVLDNYKLHKSTRAQPNKESE